MDCDSLKEMTIPASVLGIGNYAFAYCDNLETINIRDNSQIGGIYKSAFYNCIKLKGFSIPSAVQEISEYAFYGCSSMTKADIDVHGELKGIFDYASAYSG